MIVTVNVTAEHIRDGQRGKCTGCPVVLALNERFPQGAPWQVDSGRLMAAAGMVCYMPMSVTRFVRSFDSQSDGFPFAFGFDSQSDVSPFAFEIDVPEEWVNA